MQEFSYPALKELSVAQAQELCHRARQFLIRKVPTTGGHLASNLGICEISVALLRQFDLPRDRILYDTGHQCYVHKLFTGRQEGFDSLRQFGGISGFPRPSESEFDPFVAGHSSTSLSAAVGFAKADPSSWCVAVIGDGAFAGGMVFEALNNLDPKSRLIVILNDNEMSISPSVGALAQHMNRIRQKNNYYPLMEKARRIIGAVPLVGKPLARALIRAKIGLKRLVVSQSNFFEMYGLRYFGPADGNDLPTVERLLKAAKAHGGPCLIHLHTQKGKGYEPAEKDPSAFHSVGRATPSAPAPKTDFSATVGRTLLELAPKIPTLRAVTAAMCDGVGLSEFARCYPAQFCDVGIAEQHAVTSCAAMALGGLTPVFLVYSTFFQRAYDQLFHDVALQKAPVTFVLDRAGLVGEDGPTHHGLFDLSMALSLPGVEIWSPATYRETQELLREFVTRPTGPRILRVPRGKEDAAVARAFPQTLPLATYAPYGTKDGVIVTYGRLTQVALQAQELLHAKGLSVGVIKLTHLKPYPQQALTEAAQGAPVLLVLEEAMAAGGLGQRILADLAQGALALRPKLCRIRALEDFVPHGSLEALLRSCRLDAQSLAQDWEGAL